MQRKFSVSPSNHGELWEPLWNMASALRACARMLRTPSLGARPEPARERYRVCPGVSQTLHLAHFLPPAHNTAHRNARLATRSLPFC